MAPTSSMKTWKQVTVEEISFSIRDLDKMLFCPVPLNHPLPQHAPSLNGFTTKMESLRLNQALIQTGMMTSH
ncbi:hypothetical protein FQN60_015450 [Etheostoma spectabile]|uniref:Uncharacterized protein n=1 Tax=Etheostoma spectabile TaxID=54343 RepID=A0A5J5CMV0_9PERO|nr:hypothetical protein FQN60_015450 [Etheostoma spectabile]